MFDELSAKFEDAVKGLKGEAKISETNIDLALKDVRKALINADVSLSVVKEFINDVKVKAVGEEVVRGVNPSQKFIEIVNRNLILRLRNERQKDIKNNITKDIKTEIQDIEFLSQSPSRISVSVKLNYSERIINANGELISETSFKPFLKVKYILGFSNKSWKLVDYVSGV